MIEIIADELGVRLIFQNMLECILIKTGVVELIVVWTVKSENCKEYWYRSARLLIHKEYFIHPSGDNCLLLEFQPK